MYSDVLNLGSLCLTKSQTEGAVENDPLGTSDGHNLINPFKQSIT